MKGGGYYSANTKGAANVLNNAIPLMEEGVRGLLADSLFTGNYHIADVAAADGGTSQGIIRRLVDFLLAEGKGISSPPD
mgnify:FL=1